MSSAQFGSLLTAFYSRRNASSCRREEHGIDHGKNRRVRADAQRQREDSYRGETRGRPQRAKNVAEVVEQPVHASE